MTLQERRDILQQRLTTMTAQKLQIEQALAQTAQAIQQLVGALQTVDELLGEQPPTAQATGPNGLTAATAAAVETLVAGGEPDA